MPDFPVASSNKKMDMGSIEINIPIETSPIKYQPADKLTPEINDEDDFYDPPSPVGSDNNNIINELGEEHSFA